MSKRSHPMQSVLYHLFVLAFVLFINNDSALAQCDLNPTIEGPEWVCEYDTVAQLVTQEYDSYQWYSRSFLSTTPEAIEGATQRFLNVQLPDSGLYYSVEVWQDSCQELSEETNIPVLHFILPKIFYSSNIKFVRGRWELCEGDTGRIGYNFGHHPVWSKNGDTLTVGQVFLEITEGGVYRIIAGPDECPQLRFTSLTNMIHLVDCTTSVSTDLQSSEVKIYPNPIRQNLNLELLTPSSTQVQLTIVDALGRISLQQPILSNHLQELDVSHLPSGWYLLSLHTGTNVIYRKQLVKQ